MVPHDDSWAVKQEGEDDPVSTHDNQKKAVQQAEKLAAEHKVRMIIHDEDGRIESSQQPS
ncbi:DUF2188 domain-containing protein [Paenibacillus lacisoli]|uniref:DUF2188 domain-containing protein n=1 Tax=Paenibacillus lacisoli TaxID=3064525 RepID=UPI0031F327E8